MDKKMISPHNERYIGNVLVCAHLFFKTSTWNLLFLLFYAVIKTFTDSLDFFPC